MQISSKALCIYEKLLKFIKHRAKGRFPPVNDGDKYYVLIAKGPDFDECLEELKERCCDEHEYYEVCKELENKEFVIFGPEPFYLWRVKIPN